MAVRSDVRFKSATALFFHGLNTFRDDNLHLGPVHLGRMDQFLKPALEARGVIVHSIDGIGFGSPESQARHATTEIQKLGIENGATVQLLGNSMGGIVIRELARLWSAEPELNPRHLQIGKLISWGAPHKGVAIARWPLVRDHSTFRFYSPKALEEFNKRCPLNAFAPEYHFVCTANWRDVSPYFWGLAALDRAPNDGFISAESQSWGQCRGTFALDHFGQTGFHSILPLPDQRRRSRAEFTKMCDQMASLIRDS